MGALLEAGQVDLVLCGHQRVFPVLPDVGGRNRLQRYHLCDGQFRPGNFTVTQIPAIRKNVLTRVLAQILHVNGDTLSLFSYDSNGNLDSWSTAAKTTTLAGDVINYGVVDMDDVDAVSQAVLNSSDYCSTMDINGDGIIDMRDTQLVLKIYLDDAA